MPSRRSLRVLAALAGLAVLGSADADLNRFDTVVIDAGHGGEDEGARGPRDTNEKDIVLDVAKRLAARLREHGLRVVMTREADAFVPLERRVAIANDARGDLFVSIHANAASRTDARGVETYFLAERASDAEARAVALRENAAFEAAGDEAREALEDPLVSVISAMMAAEHRVESGEFARFAHAELAGLADLPGRGVKQAPFVVLVGLQMPAALVEIGFMSNPEDRRRLRDAEHREKVAAALDRAIGRFGERFDARRGRAALPGGEG